jgi:hypothetical protein
MAKVESQAHIDPFPHTRRSITGLSIGRAGHHRGGIHPTRHWPIGAGSISQRDYPVILGTILFIGFSVMIINFIVDQIYVVLDPLIRYRAGS